MKKRVVSLIAIAALAAALVGCGSSSSAPASQDKASSVESAAESTESTPVLIQSAQEAAPTEEATPEPEAAPETTSEAASEAAEESSGGISFDIQDVLVKHETFHSASGDGWDEYSTLFYGSTTKHLKGMIVETRFMKDAGYTREQLEDLDIETVYEGFGTLDFADYIIDEDDVSLTYVVRFNHLDSVENCKQMHEIGLITLDSTENIIAVDAQSFMDDFESRGMEKVDMTQYEELNLHFDFE